MMEAQNRKRAPAWTEREVRDLIAVCGEESVLSELRSSFRNAKTFVKISQGMKDRGHNRDPKQCRVKLKELRQAAKELQHGPNGRRPDLIEPGAPRTEKMAVDQDWSNVYPTAAAFNPSSVPLPIRMGYPVKRGVPPPKGGNLELIKIPNFLHLTPPAIKKHCAALKDFCTEWPTVLDSDEKCEQHFPIEIETVDYVSAGPSVRNPKARVVTLRVKLSKLNLDDHAKKKLIKLVGERYCKDTDMLTITTDRVILFVSIMYHTAEHSEFRVALNILFVAVGGLFGIDVIAANLFLGLAQSEVVPPELVQPDALMQESPVTPPPSTSDSPDDPMILDRSSLVPEDFKCPLRRQNYDYGIYLLTVLYHESWKTEMWENEKTEADMEEYIWENSPSQKNALDTLLRIRAAEKITEVTREELLGSEMVENYKTSVVVLKNQETENNILQYKESVMKLLNLQA
ncbi:28S ribosomal protein S35 [Chelonia mydas]|uniref:28S ribosomal protein S35 n=1 Tax=Chelonia mydas TaxID=8469 RepID=M7CCI9_CHEMY|nr:28S ribosomal protein S35 [Chelonia mydas]